MVELNVPVTSIVFDYPTVVKNTSAYKIILISTITYNRFGVPTFKRKGWGPTTRTKGN